MTTKFRLYDCRGNGGLECSTSLSLLSTKVMFNNARHDDLQAELYALKVAKGIEMGKEFEYKPQPGSSILDVCNQAIENGDCSYIVSSILLRLNILDANVIIVANDLDYLAKLLKYKIKYMDVDWKQTLSLDSESLIDTFNAIVKCECNYLFMELLKQLDYLESVNMYLRTEIQRLLEIN